MLGCLLLRGLFRPVQSLLYFFKRQAARERCDPMERIVDHLMMRASYVEEKMRELERVQNITRMANDEMTAMILASIQHQLSEETQLSQPKLPSPTSIPVKRVRETVGLSQVQHEGSPGLLCYIRGVSDNAFRR